MKNFTILLFVLFALNAFGQGDAPPFIQGQSQATKAVATVIKAPNSQTTKLSSSQALLETGNKNLLANPSFEHSTYSTGWTNVGGTSAVETTIVLDGAKSFKSTQAATFVSFAPSDVTAYQAQFADGSVSALASISVKAGFSVKICARKAGVTTSQCSNGSRGDSKWETIQIAFPLGATSNGFEVVSDAVATGAIYFDDAYLGFNPNFSALVNLNPDASWKSCITTGSWTTNTTYTCKYRQVFENYEYQMEASTSGAPNSATLTFNLPSGHVIDTSKMINASGNYPVLQNSTTTILDGGIQLYNSQVAYNSTTNVAPISSGATLTYVNLNLITQASPITFGSGDKVQISFSVPVVGLLPHSPTIVTTNDVFSTDTASLFHKATACLSTEIGCFNTYSYAINSNTKTICATAPTQTIASMNANGIQIFTRAYNAASTCGNPARVEAMIGTNYKSVNKSLYKNTGKSVSGEIDYFDESTTTSFGFTYKEYNEASGFLIMDVATGNTANTSRLLRMSDISATTSGYVVINASKNPAMSGIDAGDFVKSSGSQGRADIQSVYFGSGGGCSSPCTTGTCTICHQSGGKITSVTWSATGVYLINGIDGQKYECIGTGNNTIVASLNHIRASSTSTYAQMIAGGATNENKANNSVICFGGY